MTAEEALQLLRRVDAVRNGDEELDDIDEVLVPVLDQLPEIIAALDELPLRVAVRRVIEAETHIYTEGGSPVLDAMDALEGPGQVKEWEEAWKELRSLV